VGNHGGGPTIANIESIHRLDADPKFPAHLVFSTLEAFFQAAETKVGRFQLFRVNFNIMPAAAAPRILVSNVETAWLKIVYSPLRNCLLRQRSVYLS